MRTRPMLYSLILALAFLTFTLAPALAWPDAPFAKIEISGPGISGVATLTGDLLGGTTIQNFMDGDYIEKPTRLGQVYELHRYFKNESGGYWDFDRVRYYADPDGGRGYVEYVQAIGYNASPGYPEGRWFRATAEADALMTRLIASLPSAPAQPVRLPAPAQNWLTTLLFLALAGVFVIATGLVSGQAKAVKS